ncbi:hypothetical protein KY308_01990, partial [Candidatus Woesearchaeota archaeon]|nr:hypothetical protein [Candidatus Woesearchaeota archaeon]
DSEHLLVAETTIIPISLVHGWDKAYILGPEKDKTLSMSCPLDGRIPGSNICQTSIPGVLQLELNKTIFVLHQIHDTMPKNKNYEMLSKIEYLNMQEDIRSGYEIKFE